MSANIFETLKGANGAPLQFTNDSDLFRAIDGMARPKEGAIGVAILQAISDGVHRGFRGDAASIPVFAQQLEHVYTKLYEQEYADLPMANGEVLPIDTEVPNTAETYAYMTLTASGVARMGNTYAMGSIPRVSIGGVKETGNVVAILNCFGFSIQDMRVAAAVPQGGQLEQALPKAARRAHDEIQNRTGWWGSAQYKLKGLLTHPNIPVTYAPVGVSTKTEWADKTFDEIFSDVVTVIEGMPERTYGRETVTNLFMPRGVKKTLMLKRIDTTQVTLEKHIQDSYPGIKITYVDELDAAHPRNVLGVGIMVATNQDKEAASLVMPQMFELFDPQWFGMEWITVAHSRFGGVKVPRPYSVSILAAIS